MKTGNSNFKIVTILFAIVMIYVIFSISIVSAITGSIGNARMILRVDQGDLIEKSILVKNINSVSVDVELSASGDLEKNIKIIDDKFTLPPGQDKKAYFTIDVKEAGSFESKINVKFSPSEGGNGVGLSSTVIVIAGDGSGTDDVNTDDLDDGLSGNLDDGIDPGVTVSPGKNKNNDKSKPNFNSSNLVFIIPLILFIVLIGLLSFTRYKQNQIKPVKSVEKAWLINLY